MELETNEWEEEVMWEPSTEERMQACIEDGHSPARTLADNGFTYEIFCARCGKTL